MEHIKDLLTCYRTPLQELIKRQEQLDTKQLEELTAWQRSVYREVLKFRNKEQ